MPVAALVVVEATGQVVLVTHRLHLPRKVILEQLVAGQAAPVVVVAGQEQLVAGPVV